MPETCMFCGSHVMALTRCDWCATRSPTLSELVWILGLDV